MIRFRLQFMAAALLLAFLPLASADTETTRSVSVTGNAEIKVVPDEVQILVGVETEDADLDNCKKENDKKTRNVLEAARKIGVPDDLLKTDYIDLSPEREWRDRKSVLLGYHLRRSISITLRDVSKFEELLEAVLEAGATNVHNVQFCTTELRKHRDAARADAIRAAKEKAEALAAELNMQVGLPTSIQESGNWSSYPYSSWYWGGGQNYQVQNSSFSAPSGGGTEAETVALGRISISATVNVVFEMKPEGE